MQPALGSMFGFLRDKWFVDELYDAVIVRPFERGARSLAFALDWNLWHDGFHDSVLAAGFRTLAAFLSGPVDKTVVDRLFDGLAGTVRVLGSRNLQRVQTGYVRNYALGVVLGVVAVMGYFVSRSA
jgi:NADH-quinone oxidoreductase subunit L